MDGAGADGGRRLVAGRYRLVERVGSGGMGVVWRAEDERLGRVVAVKEVHPPGGLGEAEIAELRERTLREARAAARLSTPGAVAVHDVVEEGGLPYVVMELLRGPTLAETVRRDGPLPPAEVARIGLSLLTTLGAAHAAGVLHRDVKPSNVVLAEDGRVVLTDFGIARASGDPHLTSTGVLLGSPAYLAPERARGREAGPASDLFALGATLFSAVEGRPPFAGPDAMAVLMAVGAHDREPFAAAGPLEPVLAALLAADPAARPGVEEAAAMLRRALDAGGAAGGGAAGASDGRSAGGSGAATETQEGERTRVIPVPPPAPSGQPTPAEPPAPPGHAAGDEEPAAGPVSARPAPASGTGTRVGGPAAPGRPAPAPVPRPAAWRPGAGPLAAAAAVVGLVVLSGVLLLTRGGDGPDAAAPAGPASTAPTEQPAQSPAEDSGEATTEDDAGSGPAPTAEPSPEASAPEPAPTGGGNGTAGAPAGFAVFTDDDGWSLAHPPGWSADTRQVRDQSVVQITDPDDTSTYLRVSDDGTAGGDPAERWRAFAQEFAAANPSYEEVGIRRVSDYRYTPAADWEFTYEAGGERIRVLDRMFFTPDGRSYAVLAQGTDAERVREVFDAALASFRAAGT